MCNMEKTCYLSSESKPQHAFKQVLADNSYSQFKHFKRQETDLQSDDEENSNLHPYGREISNLMENPKLGFLEFLYGCENRSMEMGGCYVWVETEAQLRELVEVLNNEKVFAVDTEQHSERSFLGFTSLLQISTLSKDYLVDTIILHDVMGLLRPVFANPGICKVFHGANNDVLWLQRDFHIYVVNLFDTAKACHVLSKPQRSLAYLLETYCSVAKNKLLQREDWRRRPLPEEMIHYARADAHYLLYIAYCLCLELKQLKIENSSPGDKFHFLLEASRRSNATCLQLFAKNIEACPGEVAASSIVSRCLNDQGNISPSVCDAKFQELVTRLCLWRDVMARIHDESLRFVLPENAITALAAEIPKTEADICSSISKADLDVEFPSAVVCSHLEDLLCLLQENTANLDSIFQMFIQRHLGPSGSCPLFAYNALLPKVTLELTNIITSNHKRFRASKHFTKKVSRELSVKKFSCKAPVYDNCEIYTNDGRLLCYCDHKKLQWYVSRNLAKLVEENPPSIMLLFEPKGRPEDEDNDFCIQSKKNICVGCGEGNHYLQYRIIPSCYRTHFPKHLKSRRSHDIVLVCAGCHEIAHAAAESYKRQVAIEFGIPLFICNIVDLDKPQNTSLPVVSSEGVGVSPLQLRTAAMALLRHGPQMPSQRREELMQVVMTYYGGREITDEDLKKALLVGMSPRERRRFEKKRGFTFKRPNKDSILNDAKENHTSDETPVSIQNALEGEENGSLYTNIIETEQKHDLSNEMTSPLNDMNTSQNNDKMSLLGHGPHGKQVVTHLLKEFGEDGIHEFSQRWRQVFIKAVRPRFLPGGWDVNHSDKRDFGESSVQEASAVAAASTTE